MPVFCTFCNEAHEPYEPACVSAEVALFRVRDARKRARDVALGLSMDVAKLRLQLEEEAGRQKQRDEQAAATQAENDRLRGVLEGLFVAGHGMECRCAIKCPHTWAREKAHAVLIRREILREAVALERRQEIGR